MTRSLERKTQWGAAREHALLRALAKAGRFLSSNKRWWLPFFLLPLLLILLLAVLPSTGAVPFTYTLF